VQIAKRTEELQEAKEKYRVILEINNSIVSHLRLRDLLPSIAQIIRKKLPFDATSITLYKAERDVLEIWALEVPFSPHSLSNLAPDLEVPREGSHVGWVIDNKKPLIVYDLLKNQRFSQDSILLEEGIRSYIIIPLIIKEKAIGTFNVASREPSKFRVSDIEFLSLVAKQIALAIDNAILYEEIEKLKNQFEVESVYLQEEIKTEFNFEEIIGESRVLKKVLKQIEKVAKTDSTVLIRGETGTGKELIARAIHNISMRKDRPLIKVNCPAIPPGLIESELFGHEKGAFTGAISRRGRKWGEPNLR